MSTQNKHTPGPWYVMADPILKGKHPVHGARYVATSTETFTHRNRYDEEQWRFEHEQDSIICTMPDAENQVANARLIAAAPELLAALQPFTILNPLVCPEYAGSIELAKAAVAKAKGEQ